MRIYLATSWSNPGYEKALVALRGAGHDVYNFQESGRNEFVDDYTTIGAVSYDELKDYLGKTECITRYFEDKDALDWAEAVVCLMPCGRSAHIELGYGVGRSKITVLVWEEGEPDLMHCMVDRIVESIDEAIEFLDQIPGIEVDEKTLEFMLNRRAQK